MPPIHFPIPWAVFHVQPSVGTPAPPTPTLRPGTPPATLEWRWQPHAAGNLLPVVVKVSWEGYVETMEILPDGSTLGTHPNILFHQAAVQGCDGSLGKTIAYGAHPCHEKFDYDIDWNERAGPNDEGWSWIYFWVRDPDFTAMKLVDEADCPPGTGEWPYEYVNRGPKYSICQDFSDVYDRVHGFGNAGLDVFYHVQYEEGAPPTATSGATTTPPAGETPTY